MMKYYITGLILLFASLAFSQDDVATLYGTITSASDDKPLEFLLVYVLNDENNSTETDENGYYELEIPADQESTLVIAGMTIDEKRLKVKKVRKGNRRKIDVKVKVISQEIGEVEVGASAIDNDGMIREDVEPLKLLPTVAINFEMVLPSIGLGVTGGTGGELSAQYAVRGGNYDENLVYVNDFEIYRPQLVRAGQQEGLTFPNINLIRDLSFSSGGFDAVYGDKMSSVLDIKYKIPRDFRASAEMSFLGGSAHVEGSVKKSEAKDSTGRERFRYMIGTRYKSTQYLLGTLDTEGEYTPNFIDAQAYLSYDISKDWHLDIIGNYNRSEYNFVPESRSSAFGLIDFALNLNAVFEGQERDDFTTYMGGASLIYVPDRDKNPLYLKFLTSTYQSDENERIDIIGDYLIGQVESDLGSNDFGEIVAVLGTGTEQDFVRNYLTLNVTNIEHKGGIEFSKEKENDAQSSHFFRWGAKYQLETIDDIINEWERLDSAGYSLPYSSNDVLIRNVFKTENNLQSSRFSAYLMDTWNYLSDDLELKIAYGVRANYSTLNKELVISPRTQFLVQPKKWEKDITFRLAGGIYAQPPFYREMRKIDGTVNTDLKAQKSAHIVGGATWDFRVGKNEKKFAFIAEAYYKYLWDLVTYDLDNVRIRYSGENDATGYVVGIDMRLNGEFVPGAESWVNLSFLRARESITGVQHLKREIGSTEAIEVDDVARPTDQLMMLTVFFQDYLATNKNFKTHVQLSLGTGWPFGIPDNNTVYRNTYRFAPYRRVDIGFSAKLFDESWERASKNPFRFTKNAWISLEVFNLLEIRNEASKTWIKTVYNSQFAVPNYLTSRRINLRLRMDF